MKKILLIMLAVLVAVGGAEAQTRSKGKKKDNPVIEGRNKVRQSDYEEINKFTQFSTKNTTRYFTPFDYTRMPELTQKPRPEWGEMQPVMNYLEKVSRAGMLMCAVYAINPAIEDAAERDRLAKQARQEALDAMKAFEDWKVKKEWRNKIQYKVAEVDYRYFKGASYYNETRDEEIIHVGLMLYFGTKKTPIIDVDVESRTFNDIKFFPNDATIVESWDTLLDELSDYLKENDRKGVLLTGYADNQGTEAYATGLSRQRAVEVRKALQMRGIDPSRIEVEAKGSEDPIGDNSTYEGRIQNNRVSIKIQ